MRMPCSACGQSLRHGAPMQVWAHNSNHGPKRNFSRVARIEYRRQRGSQRWHRIVALDSGRLRSRLKGRQAGATRTPIRPCEQSINIVHRSPARARSDIMSKAWLACYSRRHGIALQPGLQGLQLLQPAASPLR